jgi:nucleoside-diphosphate-sugar epimerase
MKIVITGASGYIGSTLCDYLLKEQHEIFAIDNFLYGNHLKHFMFNKNFHPIKLDVRDFEKVNKFVSKADIVIPLAALVGAPLCEFKKQEAIEVNYESIKNIVENSSKNQIILYPTTNSGYGNPDGSKFCTEETPLNPISTYGITKVDAEKIVSERENTIRFRLATVFGCSPRMRLDLLVNDFVYKSIFDKYIILFESHFKRNYIHIRDVCDAFVFAINNFSNLNNETFNLGLSSANLSKFELCELIKKINKDFVIELSEIGKDIDKRDYIVSNEKLEKKGFKAKIDLLTGIQELNKFYNSITPEVTMRNF